MSIVLGYDESPGARRALEMAITIAKTFDEPLVLVYGAAPPGGLGEEFKVHAEALTEIARTALGHAVEEVTAAGVRPEVMVVAQKPAQALMSAADVHDARVIVVGTSGDSPLKGAVLGSTPHKLLHLSTRPVLCVPAAAGSTG